MRNVKTKIFVGIAILGVLFIPPFAKYQDLRGQNKRLENRIKFLKEESVRLEDEKRKLETDVTYIEKMAREKIGLVRKGEIVLKEAPESRTRK